MLQRRTNLTAHKKLNPISPQQVCKRNAEVPERIKLCLRCGGKPHIKKQLIKFNNGHSDLLITVSCIGGICEICHKPAGNEFLTPHEKKNRSQGGRVELQNSVMCHWRCHPISKPMWSKMPSDNTALLNQQGKVLPNEQ
jgi:hypothetical protein